MPTLATATATAFEFSTTAAAACFWRNRRRRPRLCTRGWRNRLRHGLIRPKCPHYKVCATHTVHARPLAIARKPECKQRVRFHPNHPKSIERAYLQHHNETESSGTGPTGRGSAAELAKTSRPNWVPGSWNNGLSDSVLHTVTVVRHPCQRFGSVFAAIKGLNVSVMRKMDHPDQLVEWLVKRYGRHPSATRCHSFQLNEWAFITPSSRQPFAPPKPWQPKP